MQSLTDIYGDDYAEGLEAIDSDGMVSVPEGPGMGISWDWKAVEKHAVGTNMYE